MNEDRFDALIRKYMEYDKATLAALLAQRETEIKINEPYAPWSSLPSVDPAWPKLKWTVTA